MRETRRLETILVAVVGWWLPATLLLARCVVANTTFVVLPLALLGSTKDLRIAAEKIHEEAVSEVRFVRPHSLQGVPCVEVRMSVSFVRVCECQLPFILVMLRNRACLVGWLTG